MQCECLAIVWSVMKLQPYLEGNRFNILTDHDSLKLKLDLADARSRLARWRLRTARFPFDVVNRVVFRHQEADALSLMPIDGTNTTSIEKEIPIAVIEASSNLTNKISFQQTSCQATA